MLNRIRFFMAATLVVMMAAPASAVVIYFCDDLGNVGAYDDGTGIVSPVGDLSAFLVDQVVGLAWDPANQRILILDRNAPAVYAMNPANGAATFLFDPGFTFQGGAVAGGSLYGIDESGQTVEAFNLGTFANLGLSAAVIVGHHHGLGVDTASGQIYIGGSLVDDLQARPSDGGERGGGGAEEIATIGGDGSYGTQIVTFSENVEDIEYYGSDFLLASFTGELLRVNGTTGALSVFLTSVQTASGGITGDISGVAAASGEAPPSILEIPTLGPWGLGGLALGLALAAGLLLRRRGLRGPRTA